MVFREELPVGIVGHLRGGFMVAAAFLLCGVALNFFHLVLPTFQVARMTAGRAMAPIRTEVSLSCQELLEVYADRATWAARSTALTPARTLDDIERGRRPARRRASRAVEDSKRAYGEAYIAAGCPAGALLAAMSAAQDAGRDQVRAIR